MVSYKTAVTPVFAITRSVGLFPYRIPSGCLPKAQRLFSLAINFISISIGIYTVAQDLRKKIWITMDTFRLLRRIFGRLWFILAVGTHIFWQVRHPRKIPRILNKLQSFTAFTGSQHFTCYNIAITTFGIISYGFILPGLVLSRGTSITEVLVGFVVPHVHNFLFLAQFFAYMEVIHCHFKELNHLTLPAKDLEMCVRVHAELCDVTKEVNQVYNMELLMSFASWLSSLITQWFQLHEVLTTDDEPHAGFLITLPWLFGFRCLQMWSLCHISYEVHYESDYFADALCCAIRSKYPPSFSKKLVVYLARRPSVQITSFGLFNIGTGILATILGTTMTYFIVLVQLH